MEEMRVSRCFQCGHVGLDDGVADLKRQVGGRTYTASVRAQVCPNCGEWVVTDETLGRFEAAVSRAVMASGARDGSTLKWLRKVAGLTAAELAGLLGVTSKTVSRWETEETPIDVATLHALGELAVDGGEGRTTTADALRAMASPKRRLPRTVAIAMT